MAYGSVLTDVVQSSVTGSPPQFNDGTGTQIGTICRAWVNFNGVSGSVAIRASFNVSSVTRSATGAYTITFTNAMPDANYCAVTSAWYPGSSQAFTGLNSRATTNLTLNTGNGAAGSTDSSDSNVAVFR